MFAARVEWYVKYLQRVEDCEQVLEKDGGASERKQAEDPGEAKDGQHDHHSPQTRPGRHTETAWSVSVVKKEKSSWQICNPSPTIGE